MKPTFMPQTMVEINCCQNRPLNILGRHYLVGGNFKAMEPRHDKTCLREFPIRPDTNRPAQP